MPKAAQEKCFVPSWKVAKLHHNSAGAKWLVCTITNYVLAAEDGLLHMQPWKNPRYTASSRKFCDVLLKITKYFRRKENESATTGLEWYRTSESSVYTIVSLSDVLENEVLLNYQSSIGASRVVVRRVLIRGWTAALRGSGAHCVVV
ncbi:hypothetical protein EVAR_91242_1 [Eumeta japonica]|uniref:Uncharacterized protein n=1 Tax=Eumeta variegata TaxID=151549 RepID=A0A4C2A1Y4_EUMVA|nr:hypothetical protein EVAR_91242_1 [Eumeta japonica]